MSKHDNRKIVDFEDAAILADLELPELLKDYKHFATKAADYESRRKITGKSILAAVEEVKADVITYEDWTVVLVKPEPSNKLDEELLKEAMGKIGKLDAATISRIFVKATVKGDPKEAYVRVTAPKTKGKK